MDCSLCMEIEENINKSITINSNKWQELNVRLIIEKYLWKIENLNVSTYICQSCWQELYNFHIFYSKIEKAHTNLNGLVKTKIASEDIFRGTVGLEEKETLETINNNAHEPEVLLLKLENPLEVYENEDVEEFGRHIQTRAKRKCCAKKDKNCKRKITKIKINVQNEEKIAIKLENKESSNYKENNSLENINEVNDGDNDDDTKLEDYGDDDGDSTNTKDQRETYDKFIEENFELSCNVCYTTFGTFTTLLKHYKEEHNERGYAFCCNRRHYSRTDLIDHIKLHKNPEQFKCEYCDKTLSSRACLKLHIRNIHDPQSIECDICGRSLANESSLKIHKLLHEVENDGKIPCTQCEKTFISKYFLDNHITKVHLKKYHKICDLCGLAVSDKRTFKRHMLEHEGIPLPTVTCEICGRRLSDKKCLKRHMNSHHPPEGAQTKFSCPICTKTFASRNGVKMHVKIVHENGYESKCTMCEKTFKRPDALRDHMAKHTGKPLHACGFCPKTFYSNGQMHNHRKTVHPMEWQETVRKRFSGNLPEKYVSNTLENEDEGMMHKK